MSALSDQLVRIVGAEHVPPATDRTWLTDASVSRGIVGRADAVVLPGSADEVARVIAWCYEHDVAIVPRGGGTGFSAGAVPIDGGVVLALERLRAVRAFDPGLWRMHVEAGVRTAHVARIARESGLLFAPDPGAAEQSQIGGNIATNAGGPHAFKYGTTGASVTGVEAVVAPGELVSVGGPMRKDVAGYALADLLIGSEGTLGVITAAWLRLLPAPEAAHVVAATFGSTAAGCAAVLEILARGATPAALEFLDAGTLAASGGSYPGELGDASFLLLAEADGSREEAARVRDELMAACADAGALDVTAISGARALRELWRWRDGVSIAVTAAQGGKLSEDIVVPVERLAEAIESTVAIGARHELAACSWGHAGDGNLHSTFLLRAGDADQLERAERAAVELFEMAVAMGGSISGEHGLGWVKRGRAAAQWGGPAADVQRAIKRALDPKNLLNPGKKTF
jgi:glycolate oxidase subunit GlcD